MRCAFFTIGHSTRSIPEFVELLRQADIELVADVRTLPRSRTNPQYNLDAMPATLAPFGIAYEHIAQLGGLRGKARAIDAQTNAYWNNKSFHNYADYAWSESFEDGLDHLINLGHRQTCVIMCSEAVWWRCHRRIIADYLISRGEQVFHLMGKSRLEPATQNKAAQPVLSGKLSYPAEPPT